MHIISFTRSIIFIALALLAIPCIAAEPKEVVIYYFYGDGCPHCAQAKNFLDDMEATYATLEVKRFETWKNTEHNVLFTQMAEAYDSKPRGVPTFFIGDYQPIVGYRGMSITGKDIEEKITYCLQQGCVDPGKKIDPQGSTDIIDPVLPDELCIHIFVDQRCPECQRTKDFIDTLETEHLLIYFHDVNNATEKQTYESFKSVYGLKFAGYPIMFVGDHYFIGSEAIQKNLVDIVEECRSGPCPCPAQKISGITPFIPQKQDYKAEERNDIIDLPILGVIDIGSMSLGLVTLIISFIDGFNPCSLWVLTFLLGIVIYSGSRKKIIIVGLTFLFVTASAYGLFMLGLINVFSYIGFTGWIRGGVVAIATIFAIVNIKDYFWYKKGLSFTISDKHKPSLFRRMRNIMNPSSSITTMIVATFFLALGIVLVELPCTAGFPMMWTSIMAQQEVVGLEFAVLFSMYILIYLIIELVIFFMAVITLKAGRFEEKHGRILKLIGGIVMFSLAAGLLFFPESMNSIGGSIAIFGTATVISVLIIYLHRVILPRFGIVIGTETMKEKTTEKEEE